MRILIDENVPVQLLEMLRRLLPDHEVRHVSEIKWAGKKDLALLPDAARKGFHAFLTKDTNAFLTKELGLLWSFMSVCIFLHECSKRKNKRKRKNEEGVKFDQKISKKIAR